MGGKTATLLSSHVNDIFIGESSVFLPSREEIHAHLHSKLKEGFVSVAAFQPLVSYVISSLRRIEHSCQQGKRLDKKEVHAHLHSKLKKWFVSVGAFQPQVSDFGELNILASKRIEIRYGLCTSAVKICTLN